MIGLLMQKDPYYSEKDTLRWHGASFQIIQVFVHNHMGLPFHYSIGAMLMSITVPVRAIFAHIVLHAETQFEKYRITQDRVFESDFDRFLELKISQSKLEREE